MQLLNRFPDAQLPCGNRHKRSCSLNLPDRVELTTRSKCGMTSHSRLCVCGLAQWDWLVVEIPGYPILNEQEPSNPAPGVAQELVLVACLFVCYCFTP